MRKAVTVSLLALGFTSLLSQVVMIRELTTSFFGNEFFIGWVLFAWVFWTAMGSLLARIFPKDSSQSLPALALCHFLLIFLFPSTLALARYGRLVLGPAAGALPELVPSMVYTFLILVPVCSILGLQFVLGLRCLAFGGEASESDWAGKAYLYEILGFVAGGLLFSYGFVFTPEFRIAVFLAALNFTSALLVAFYCSKKTKKVFSILGLAAFAFLIWLSAFNQTLERGTDQARFPDETLVETRKTIRGNLTVTQLGKQYNFYQNGFLLGAADERLAAEYLAHFPMLFHPEPRKILLLGSGFNGALHEILKYAPEKVVTVELDPEQIALAKKYLPESFREDLVHPRVEAWFGDGRSFLKQNQERFDVILVNMPVPSTVLTNRYYTTEFFQDLAVHLSPKGVVGTHFKFAANYVTPELETFGASVLKTFRGVLPHTVMLPEDTLYLMGSPMPLPEGPATLVERFKSRGLQNHFVTADYISYRLTNDRVDRTRILLNQNRTARINTDLWPSGYFYEFLYWVSSFSRPLAQVFSKIILIPFWGIGILFFAWPLLPLCFAQNRQTRDRISLTTAMVVSGFSLMAMEILVIYLFQVFYGNLYYRIAWIITSFMAGMGAGTWMSSRRSDLLKGRGLGVLHAGFVVISVTLFFLCRQVMQDLPQGVGEVFFLVLAVCSGGLTGFEFPSLVRLSALSASRQGTAGRLYAADLLGSGVGALLTAGFLIPVWGVLRTIGLLMLTNMVTGLLLFFRKNLGRENV